LLRQSIIHVEQDDIDFDEDDSKNPERGAGDGGESSQDVEMSGADVDTTDPSFSESAPVTNADTAGSSGGVPTSPRPGRAEPVPPAQPKRKMVITHDKFVQLQSLVVLHLSQVEQATGKGVDREELIDWYLEFKEGEIQDEEAFEYEKELITKMLRKLVKVSVPCSHNEKK
jgi:DNA replication licensing factor MCM6